MTSYILVDANDKSIDWNYLVGQISEWMISVGSMCPIGCDYEKLRPGDVELLVVHAGMIIADTNRSRNLALRWEIPFILVKDVDEALEEIQKCLT